MVVLVVVVVVVVGMVGVVVVSSRSSSSSRSSGWRELVGANKRHPEDRRVRKRLGSHVA